MNPSSKLYNLQLIDSQIRSINQDLMVINDQLNDDKSLKLLEGILTKSNTQFQNASKGLSDAEKNVKQQRIKIEQTEAALYSGTVKNPKELQSMQSEVQALKRFLAVLEERQLESMLQLDDVAGTLEIAKNNHGVEKIRREKLVNSLTDQKQNLLSSLAKAKNERDAFIKNIDPDLYQTYSVIEAAKGGIAVAKIIEQACDSCGTRLTAAHFQLAKSPTQLVKCSTCGRILHY